MDALTHRHIAADVPLVAVEDTRTAAGIVVIEAVVVRGALVEVWSLAVGEQQLEELQGLRRKPIQRNDVAGIRRRHLVRHAVRRRNGLQV